MAGAVAVGFRRNLPARPCRNILRNVPKSCHGASARTLPAGAPVGASTNIPTKLPMNVPTKF